MVKSTDGNSDLSTVQASRPYKQHWHTFTNNQWQYHLLRGQSPNLSKYCIGGTIKQTLCIIQTHTL